MNMFREQLPAICYLRNTKYYIVSFNMLKSKNEILAYIERILFMYLPSSDNLDIQYLSRLFDNKSECYKLFWFQAIVNQIINGKDHFTYEELVDEMIADAWYMVSEYHLNLGPKDNLEIAVKRVQSISGMKPSEKKEILLDYLHTCSDKEVKRIKRILIENVPYRLQAPFLENLKGKSWDVPKKDLISRINQERSLIYYFRIYDGMNTIITIQPQWMDYIVKNQEIIKGWLQYHMIIYLQKRNPSVPGIADKLYPPQERKLDKVKKYWKMLIELQPVHEIYGNIELTKDDISIDHFVPWSYVAHDEFWNLHPTTRSINSKKSNHLPDWEKYFFSFCEMGYLSYSMLWQNDRLHEEFDKCAKEHLNNDDIKQKLYRPGLKKEEFADRLSEIVLPVYQSAKNSGFSNWVLCDERAE